MANTITKKDVSGAAAAAQSASQPLNTNLSTLAVHAPNTANGAVITDSNNLIPYDGRQINLDNITLCVDGDSIAAGYTNTPPATNNYGYDLTQLPFFYGHLIPITGTTASSTASGSSSIVLNSSLGFAVGQVVTAAGIPTGSLIGSISGNTISLVNYYAGTAVTTTATIAAGATISTKSYYNTAVPNSYTGTGLNSGNNITDRYLTCVYPHRPWAGSPMPPVFGIAPTGATTGTAGAGTVTGDSNITLTFTNSVDVTALAVNGTILLANGTLFKIASKPTSTTATVASINGGPSTLAGINPSASTFLYGGDGGVKSYLLMGCGTNDANNSVAGSAIVTALNSYATTAMAAGFTLIATPILPCSSQGYGQPGDLAATTVNTAYHSLGIPFNFFSEIDCIVPNPANTVIYNGGLHLTSYGHQLVSQYLHIGFMAGTFINYADSAAYQRAAPFWWDGIHTLSVNGANGTFSTITGTQLTVTASTVSSSGTVLQSINPIAATVTGTYGQGTFLQLSSTATSGHVFNIGSTASANSLGGGILVISDATGGKSWTFNGNNGILNSNNFSGGVNVVTASTTLTASSARFQVDNGTGGTVFTLPAPSTANAGMEFYFKARGTGAASIASASGSQIFSTSPVATLNIPIGTAFHLVCDGTYWNVM